MLVPAQELLEPQAVEAEAQRDTQLPVEAQGGTKLLGALQAINPRSPGVLRTMTPENWVGSEQGELDFDLGVELET